MPPGTRPRRPSNRPVQVEASAAHVGFGLRFESAWLQLLPFHAEPTDMTRPTVLRHHPGATCDSAGRGRDFVRLAVMRSDGKVREERKRGEQGLQGTATACFPRAYVSVAVFALQLRVAPLQEK